MDVLLDLRGAQSATDGQRGGIHRYVSQLAAQLLDHPSLELHGVVHPGRHLPPVASELARRQMLHTPAEVGMLRPPFVHHIASAFDLTYDTAAELTLPSRCAPGAARVLTAYDAIPLGDDAGSSVALRRRWSARAELLRTADLVLAISDAAAHELTRVPGVDSSRVRVVGTGVAAGGPLPLPCIPGLTGPYVLYTGGTADPRKHVATLVEAYCALPADQRDAVQLVVASHIFESRREDLLAMAAGAGAADRLIVAGWIDDDTLAALLHHARLLVYPSAHEGFGLPIAEAMAHHTPVLATDDRAALDLHGHPEGTVPAGNRAALTAAMSRLLPDDAALGRLVTWGRVRAGSHTWEAVAGRTVAAYEEALSLAAPRQVAPRPADQVPTLACWRAPRLGSPAHGGIFMAIEGGTGVRLALPNPVAWHRAGVRAVPVGSLDEVLSRNPGPLVAIVEAPDELDAAAATLRAHRGLLVLWELDQLLDSSGRAVPGLAPAAAAAVAVIVRDHVDAWRARAALGRSICVEVQPPPSPWPPPAGVTPMLLAATATEDRSAVRAGRQMPVVTVYVPSRFGPASETTMRRAGLLAAALDVRVDVIAATEEDARRLRWTEPGRRARLLLTREPAAGELLAALSASDIVVVLDPEERSAGEAATDLAIALGRPVVSATVGAAHPLVTRLSSVATAHDLVDAVRAVLADPPGADAEPHPSLALRSPGVVRRRLLQILATTATASAPRPASSQGSTVTAAAGQ
jgi:glycosyltransferase involved in cell wall biosynthesis